MFKLTDRQEAFVKEYLVDLNGSKAAIRAGYKESNARQTAYENLTKPYIQDAVEKAFNDRMERVDITIDFVLGTIKADVIRNSTPGDTYNSQHLLKGCELLGRHLKLFTDKLDLGGTVALSDMSETEIDRKLKALEMKFQQSTLD